MTDKGKDLVTKVSSAIRSLGLMPVEIHGHCKCDCGNTDLSRARAQTVADKLKEEGCQNEFIIVPHADAHPEIKAQMLVRIIPRPGGAADDRHYKTAGEGFMTPLGYMTPGASLQRRASANESEYGLMSSSAASRGDGGNAITTGVEQGVSGSLAYVSDSAASVTSVDTSNDESEGWTDAAPQQITREGAGGRNRAREDTSAHNLVASRLDNGSANEPARGGQGLSTEESENSAEKMSEMDEERQAASEMVRKMQAIDSQVLQHMATIKHEACLAQVQVCTCPTRIHLNRTCYLRMQAHGVYKVSAALEKVN